MSYHSIPNDAANFGALELDDPTLFWQTDTTDAAHWPTAQLPYAFDSNTPRCVRKDLAGTGLGLAGDSYYGPLVGNYFSLALAFNYD